MLVTLVTLAQLSSCPNQWEAVPYDQTSTMRVRSDKYNASRHDRYGVGEEDGGQDPAGQYDDE